MPTDTEAQFNLKERQGVVQTLWTAVNEGGAWLNDLPRIVRVVIETGAWAEREVDGKIVKHKRFVDFITTAPRAGCGWPIDKVEKLIKDDAETLRAWTEAVKHRGSRSDLVDNINQVKAKKGTSKAYTLDRLHRERPDLFEQVKAKKLSANAAAIEAGFRKKPKRCCPNCGHQW